MGKRQNNTLLTSGLLISGGIDKISPVFFVAIYLKISYKVSITLSSLGLFKE